MRPGGRRGGMGPAASAPSKGRRNAEETAAMNDDEERPKVPISRVVALAVPDRGVLIVGTLCLAVASFCNMALPAVAGSVIDTISTGGTEEELQEAALFLIVVAIVGAMFSGMRGYIFTMAGERLVKRVRIRLFERIMAQEIGFFDVNRTGELINRLSADTQVIQSSLTVNISMLLRGAVQASASLTLMFYTSWKLSLVILCIIPVLVGTAAKFGGFVRKTQGKMQDALAEAAEVAEESLSSIRTVRSFSRENWEVERYSEKVEVSYLTGLKLAKGYGGFLSSVFALAQCAIAAVLYAGGRLVLKGEMSIGELTAFLMYVIFVAASLGMLSGVFAEFSKAVGASGRIFELLDREPELNSTGGETPEDLRGEIVMKGIHFEYPSAPEQKVLKGMNITVKPGQVVAIVGPSGGGKSTVMNLLERFYLPTAGQITYNGHDLATLDPVHLRKRIGLVQQEPVLFDGTISYNLRYGKRDLTQQAIEAVSMTANAHEFVKGFTNKYDTNVGERGVKLSGGQKQRVAIARALALDPSVLLLDEATSALDAESEHLVQKAIDEAVTKCTTIIIAHRLSTVKRADQIIVIDGGVVAQKGTHEELLAGGGVYADLVKRQLEQAGA